MPDPRSGESRDDFIGRCIPVVLEDGTAEDQDQAVAVCISMWDQDKGAGMEREYKTFPAIITKVDEALGIVEPIWAVMGNIDEGEDIVHPGAFTKTFAERGLKVKVLDHHNRRSILDVIGKPLELRELSRAELPAELLERYPEATGGAYAKVQLLMDTPEGRGAFIRLRDKAVTEWSFGFDVMDSDLTKEMRGGKEIVVRNLRTLKLYEISPVVFGMNTATTTLSAKDADNTDAPEADDTAADTPEADTTTQERKQGLVATLRTALAEAEALALLEADPLDTSPAPDEDSGRDDDADDSGAGPVTPPTSEETERMRLELLSQLESVLED